MSRLGDAHVRAALGFPRVSGDEPPLQDAGIQGALFSPRERG